MLPIVPAPSSMMRSMKTRRGNRTPISHGRGAMKKDYVATIAEQLIAQLEAGTAPWVKPWRPGARFMPFNPITNNDYRGMNAVILLMTAEALGYGDPRWMTYKQTASEGGQVRRGEKSTLIQYWKWREERPIIGPDGAPLRDTDGKALIEVVELVRPRVFTAAVFNGAQIDGLAAPEMRPALPEWQRHEMAETILTNSGASIQHLACDRAAYNRILDAIVLPERTQFATADGYYATALHELGHWTGHETRLARDLAHPFGSEGYAREELRAEIASLMLGDRLGIGHDPSQHAAYVGHFLQILRSEPQEIFRAASDAEKIVTFLQRFQQTQTVDQTVTAERGIVLPASASGERSSAPVHATERVFVAVPYAEKDQAKALGAKWDRRARSWYLPAGIDLAPFARWRQDAITRAPEDPRLEFAEALQAAGLMIDGLPLMDGKLHRVVVEGDRTGRRSGAYVGYLDAHPAGFLENFRTGVRKNWKSQVPRETLSAVERARLIAEATESRRRRRQAERQVIAAETARLVEAHLAGPPLLVADAAPLSGAESRGRAWSPSQHRWTAATAWRRSRAANLERQGRPDRAGPRCKRRPGRRPKHCRRWPQMLRPRRGDRRWPSPDRCTGAWRHAADRRRLCHRRHPA
jgi:putative DNA primase/helicase